MLNSLNQEAGEIMSKVQLQNQLFEEMIRRTDYRTVKYYAEILHVSVRTLHSYLDEMQERFKLAGYELLRKPGQGILLQKTANADKSEPKANVLDIYSTRARQLRVIRRLLIERRREDMYDFASENYVSENTLRGDISLINGILSDFGNIKIRTSGSDLYLENKMDESSFMNALIRLIEIFLFESSYINNKNSPYECLFPSEMISFAYQLLDTYLSQMRIVLARQYRHHLISTLIVFIWETSHGRHASEKYQLVMDQMKFTPNRILALQFIEAIKTEFPGEFTDGDSAWLAGYLKADRVQISGFDEVDEENRSLFERLIRRMESVLNIRFDESSAAFHELICHLNAMVYRLKNGIFIRNELTKKLEEEFEMLMNLTWLVFESELSEAGLAITKDEVAFLIIHFQNAIEAQQEVRKIILVCPYGTTTSRMIKNKLRKILPPFNCIESSSLKQIEQYDNSSADFMISTVPIPDSKIPVVQVSSVMSRADLRRIMNFYQDLILEQEEPALSEYPHLAELIDPSLNFAVQNGEDMKEIIHKECTQLLNLDLVQKGFEESMLEREERASTDNTFLTAIPHGQTRYVNQSLISFALLPRNRKWKNYPVRLVIFFVISQKDIKNCKPVLEELYRFLKSETLKTLLHSEAGLDQVVALIYGGTND